MLFPNAKSKKIWKIQIVHFRLVAPFSELQRIHVGGLLALFNKLTISQWEVRCGESAEDWMVLFG